MDQIVTNSEPQSMLECMLLIRAYEEKLAAMQSTGGAPGTCTSVGQEAAAVGVVRALDVDDLILTNHRSAGHLLARGASPGRLMAEVMGRSTGYCQGKSGSLHISAKDLGVVLTSTIVGGELSLATGVALAQSMLGKSGVVTCFFGDGAACEGVFHESLNLAAVWGLPILYVCENNQWQAFVRRDEVMSVRYVSRWAESYGIAGTTVDGNDVQAVHKATQLALSTIRSTGKPYLLETYTYRTRGHYEPDDQAYVDANELAYWKARDPIVGLQRKLLENVVVNELDIERMKERVAAAIADAHDFACASPMPEASELFTDVYA